MQINTEFLEFKPSEIAAAALLTAIKIKECRESNLSAKTELVKIAAQWDKN